METIPLEQRISSFDEVHTGYSEELAKKEAQRCLFCAICAYCKQCEKVCELDAIVFDDTPKEKNGQGRGLDTCARL